MRAGAELSNDRAYRYVLWREWDNSIPAMVVIGLNPSTADESEDDPTIRRCIAFAKREGFGRLVMLNLFALRATDPKWMMRHADPIGPENDRTLHQTAVAGKCLGYQFVAAWGAHGSHLNRAREVRNIFAALGVPLLCLGRTSNGAPRHPLYLRADTPLTEMRESA